MGETSFLNFVLLTLLFAIAGNAFQPYYCHQQYRVGNILHQQDYNQRRLVQLSYAPTDPSILEQNRQYLSNTLGFSKEKLDKIAASQRGKRSRGSILNLKIGILDDRVSWLQNRLCLTDNEIKKIIQSQPSILWNQSESDTGIGSKIDYLQNRLLLDDILLRKVIIGNPSILLMSVEDNIEPTLDWLQGSLQLDDTALSKVIQRQPTILHLSIEDNLEPTLQWLQNRLQLDDDALGKTIKRLPSILGTTTGKMEPKLDWLQQRLLLSDEELSKMIQQYPTLLSFSIENNLEPTFNFYIDALGNEGEALVFVTRDPSAFSRSLENRLKPRLKQALDTGMVIDSKLMRVIMVYPNDQWNGKVTREMSKKWVRDNEKAINERNNK